MRNFIFVVAIFLFSACNPTTKKNVNTKQEDRLVLFVGTYTHDSESKGIYVYEFDVNTAGFKLLNSTNSIDNPSYLTFDRKHNIIYTVNETSEDSISGSGRVTSLKLDTSNWSMTKMQTTPSLGAHPCYISLDKDNNYCFVANYTGSSVSIFDISEPGVFMKSNAIVHKGSGPHKNQDKPHLHMILQDNETSFIYATDLGADKVYQYTSGSTNTLKQVNEYSLKPGTGPRHLSIHPDKAWLYVLGELNGTITCFSKDPNTGSLEKFQTISSFDTNLKAIANSADIHIHPNGRYLYTSNRGGLNNIALFSINPDTGVLNYINSIHTGGYAPRNFVIDPTGKYLLVGNQNSDRINVFEINAESGELIKLPSFLDIPKPVCLKFY